MPIAAGMKEIAQGIVSSREVRVAAVKGLKKEAAEMLGSAGASRDEMGAQLRQVAAQLRQDLAHDKAKMGAEVKALRSGFQGSHKKMGTHLRKALADYDHGIESEVAGMLGAFEASRDEMAAQLRQDLAQLRKGLADYDRGRKSEVAGMRQEAIADLAEARTAWQLVASNGHAKRGRAEILPKEEARVDKEAPRASKKGQTRPRSKTAGSGK